MSPLLYQLPSLSSIVSGFALHLLILRHGEWDQSAPVIVSWYLAIVVVGLVLPSVTQLHLGAGPVFQFLTCHLAGLFSSIIIYRVFFHRLRKFPGPTIAGITAFYASYLSAKKFHKFKEIEILHQQYGDYVRVGPRELSIADPRAVLSIYGPLSKTTKGPFYDGVQPYISLHSDRDQKRHARRRRTWDHAFSTNGNFPHLIRQDCVNQVIIALRDYEHRVSRYSSQLLSAVSDQVGRAIDMGRWFNYYSFDIMGDLTFGKSFEMLVTGQDSYMLSTLHNDLQSLGPFLHVMWFIPFFKMIPGLNNSYIAFWKWLYEQVDTRSKVICPTLERMTLANNDVKTRTSQKHRIFLPGS
jgi:hypothetical protein